MLDRIQAAIAERRILLRENGIHDRLQEIASAMKNGLGFTYNKVIYLRPEVLSKILSFNQLYAQCLIARIKEIQTQHTDEEIFLTKELFSLLPSRIGTIVINNFPYIRGRKKTNTKGEILQEVDILSNIIDD